MHVRKWWTQSALSLVMLALVSGAAQAADDAAPAPAGATENPVVVIETSKGTIEAELFADKAPISVANFLAYTKDGFYDGTIFHRVIPSFMVQGGGFTAEMEKKPTKAPIKNEATNGLANEPGTLAMARTSIVDSATAQFFINTKNNQFLNHKDTTPRGYGYAVFGKVTEGMEVVQKIEDARTTTKNGMRDVPVETITIESVRLKK